jgi:hypothetical protein
MDRGIMDEQEVRAVAWSEGAEAAWEWSVSRGDGFPVNPYTPVVGYTPSLEEMNRVLRKTFTQEEIWRAENQLEDQLVEHVRVKVIEELQQLRSVDVDPLVVQTINQCVGAIKRMKG